MSGGIPFWSLLCSPPSLWWKGLNPHIQAPGPSFKEEGKRSFIPGQRLLWPGEGQIFYLNIYLNILLKYF